METLIRHVLKTKKHISEHYSMLSKWNVNEQQPAIPCMFTTVLDVSKTTKRKVEKQNSTEFIALWQYARKSISSHCEKSSEIL